MKILVIGGTGFIGPYVVRQLHQTGHEVTVFHRGFHESELAPGIRHIHSADANIPVVALPGDVLSQSFEVVIHMIAMGERDARAAVGAFAGRSRRLVMLSSGDVYLAYGRFMKTEPGPLEPGLLTEDSPLRTLHFPYRPQAQATNELNYFYEKILVEREVSGRGEIESAILRLPKVYGPGQNANLATVYSFRHAPDWRWTHGYVENVASAVVLAALHPAAANRIYNVGELYTPTVSERLKALPETPANILPADKDVYDLRQNIAFDTRRIRQELGYEESISYEEGLRRTLPVEVRSGE